MRGEAVRDNRRKNAKFLLLVLSAVTLLAAFLCMGIGSIYIWPGQIIGVLAGESSSYAFVIENYRLPRTVLAILSGAGFAVSGVILQGMIRNPLASPDVVGVTKGAGLFAVVVIILFPAASPLVLPVVAFLGALAVAVVLILFANRSGAQPGTFALVGLAVGAICQALTEFILVKYPLQANDSLVWLAGSLWGKGWDEIYGLLPWLCVLLPLSLSLHRKLDIINLDEVSSTGLGLHVERTRYVLLVLAVALAGACVAAIGSIGFIGLIAPHIARKIFGSQHRYLLPGAAILGGLILVLADALGRGLRPPTEIPAGILTAMIGVPYFLYLVHQEKKKA
ncbi:iron ABC transporter permease [Brevibacillus nitrificans]|uniref:Iron ABC transporter permease n=2 Tax=Brevibacillus nitrificans TaxID=651560 RepID=A0A3M8D4Y3_9BACL|nr:iron ABC transporter permease [Brevibacillus nitrificans]